VPTSALRGAAHKSRDRREGHQVTGGVIERLCRQRFRLADTKSFRFGGIEAACCLHQRIEATPACPRAFVAVCAKRDVDNARPDPCDILRAKAERGDGAGR